MTFRPAGAPDDNAAAATPPPPWLKTDTGGDASTAPATGRPTPEVRRLFVFFSVAYLAQGIGQQAGVVSQPVTYYFKEALGMDAGQIPQALAVLVLPWTIKPLYGLISDLFPVAGYRRRSYLVIMTALAICGFASLFFASGATAVIAALFVTSVGIAFSDVLVDALMIENGNRTGWTRQFQGVQWAWMYGGMGAAALIGGQLCGKLRPADALHVAALIPIPLLVAMVLTALRNAPEQPAPLNREEVRENLRGVGSAFRSPTLWKAAAILALIGFEPSIGTPYYFHLTDTLKISQEVIGASAAIGGAGAILGAVGFSRFLAPRFSQRTLLIALVVIGSVGALGVLLIRDAVTLLALSFFGGVFMVMGRLVLLSIAAEACPKRAEAFTFAALMGVMNLANQGGAILGGKLFVALGNRFEPLVFVTAATTLLGLLLLPLAPPGRRTER